MSGEVVMVAVALGRAVIQSLWQMMLIGAVVAVLAIAVRGARWRYVLWCLGLGSGVGWFVWTFVSGLEAQGGAWGTDMVLVSAVRGIGAGETRGGPAGGGLGIFELVAALWVMGFAYVAWRTLGQWRASRRLRVRDVWAPEGAWLGVFEGLRGELGVSRRVGMLVSGMAQSPMVVGWISPVVIVPASVLTMLSPEQVRLVLTHELAHIRRCDHLVNLLQVLVEAVLFYHPVVWWMSHQIRIEREHCCDDAAVREPGNAVVFARALTELETARTRSRALLALHQGGSLMKRVKRIMEKSGSDRRGNSSTRALAVLAAGVMIAGAGYAHAAMRAQEQEPVVRPGLGSVETLGTDEARRAAVIEFIRTNVVTGVLSEERALRLFADAVQPEYNERIGQFKQKIHAASEAGRISEAEGLARLISEQQRIDADIELRFFVEIRGMAPDEAELIMLAGVLNKEVAAGNITRDEADSQLARARRLKQRPVVEGERHLSATGTVQDGGAAVPIEFTVRMIGPGRLELTRVVPESAAVDMQEDVLWIIDGGGQSKQTAPTITISNGEIVTGEPLIIPADQLIQPEPAKLTPMDDEYWIHLGVRPLSAYDESFDDGC